MATSGVEEFLRAEDEAYRLVDELETLKKEVESYATARESLEEAQQAMTQLSAKIGDLAGRSTVVIETLAKIGTPEILARLDDLNRGVAALQSGLASIEANLGSAMEKSRTEFVHLRERGDQQFKRVSRLILFLGSVLLVLLVIAIGLLLAKA